MMSLADMHTYNAQVKAKKRYDYLVKTLDVTDYKNFNICTGGHMVKCPYCGKRVKILKNNTIARHGFEFMRGGSSAPQFESGNTQVGSCHGTGVTVVRKTIA